MQIGLFGGTFDPIHTAHLELSNLILDSFKLDKVIFIPSGNSYFKSNVTDKWDRYRMVKLAIEEYPNFEVSDLETKRDGETYTYETIIDLKDKYSNDVLYWIMGSDTFIQLPKWKNYIYLLENIRFIVYMRPGEYIDEIYSIADKYKKEYDTIVEVMEDELFLASSTKIRNDFYKSNVQQSLVTEKVSKYIMDHNLYR